MIRKIGLSAVCVVAIASATEPSSLPSSVWHAGTHYRTIEPPQATRARAGKIEVIEVFWYGCEHCRELEPILEHWLKTSPSGVDFVRVPVAWKPHRDYARLYYTLKA